MATTTGVLDPFAALGVDPAHLGDGDEAAWRRLRRAYLHRVKLNHPDRGG